MNEETFNQIFVNSINEYKALEEREQATNANPNTYVSLGDQIQWLHKFKEASPFDTIAMKGPVSFFHCRLSNNPKAIVEAKSTMLLGSNPIAEFKRTIACAVNLHIYSIILKSGSALDKPDYPVIRWGNYCPFQNLYG